MGDSQVFFFFFKSDCLELCFCFMVFSQYQTQNKQEGRQPNRNIFLEENDLHWLRAWLLKVMPPLQGVIRSPIMN